MNKTIFILSAFFCLLIFPEKSFAYLDPGSGSFILQMLIGAFLGAMFTLKIYWRKLKSFFGGSKNSNSEKTEK